MLESALATLIDEFSLNSDCVKWVLSIGMAAPSHPLLVLLDGKDGEKTRELIQTKVCFTIWFLFVARDVHGIQLRSTL